MSFEASRPTDRDPTPRPILINEVGPRDGLQNEPEFIATDAKVALINSLAHCGFKKIEATSFTSPRAIPPLADADDVMRKIERVEGVVYSALVPNVRGAERAIAAGTDEFNLIMSVSESHNRSNLRMGREESFAALRDVIELARQSHKAVSVSLSCSFGCPIEGEMPKEDTLYWVSRYAELGVHNFTLCDTTGMAFPSQVSVLAGEFRRRWEQLQLTLHFHNTRGLGLANVLAALSVRVDRFDACLGGLGGCPYAPGATGNICTEDTVHMLELMGFPTGIDLERLLACSRALRALVGHDLPGQVVKAGPRLRSPGAALA